VIETCQLDWVRKAQRPVRNVVQTAADERGPRPGGETVTIRHSRNYAE
jgi:hypothetical protein